MNLKIKLDNQSKMGIKIEQGKERLMKYLESHLNINTIVIEYGGNDSDYDWKYVANNKSKNHIPYTSLTKFIKGLIDIIEILKERNIKPILMTLPPISAQKYYLHITEKSNDVNKNIIYFLGDVELIYRRQELYSNAIFNVAKKYNIEIVDIRSKYLEVDNFTELICDDGIHPNEEGQNLIVNTFIEYFKD